MVGLPLPPITKIKGVYHQHLYFFSFKIYVFTFYWGHNAMAHVCQRRAFLPLSSRGSHVVPWTIFRSPGWVASSLPTEPFAWPILSFFS